MFKKLTLCAAFFAVMYTANAQQLRTPQPSPTQTVKQDFGLGTIELVYSRPSLRNRKLYTDLAPAGAVWRTGANQATTLTFSDEVTIGGTKVPAGKYGLLSIPSPTEWTLIITKQTDVTSPAAYKQDQDVVRVAAKPIKTGFPNETFTIQFANLRNNAVDLHLLWSDQAVPMTITTDVDSRVMTQINNLMNKDNRPYFNAAMYYMENGKDMNQALAWFDKAIEQQPTAFWVHYQRAHALAKLGKKAEARAAANKSIELARTAKNDDYVRMNEALLKTL